jgi:hypothetical protein
MNLEDERKYPLHLQNLTSSCIECALIKIWRESFNIYGCHMNIINICIYISVTFSYMASSCSYKNCFLVVIII